MPGSKTLAARYGMNGLEEAGPNNELLDERHLSAMVRALDFDWRNQGSIVIPRAVDPGTNLVGHHTFLRVLLEYRFGLARRSC